MSDIENLIENAGMLLRHYKYIEVIDLCSKVLKINSTNEFALMYMGKAYYHLRNYDESKKYLEKVYVNYSSNPNIIRVYSQVLLKSNDLDKALSLYDPYIESEDAPDGNNVAFHFESLSSWCANENRKEDAMKCLDYYLKFHPDNKEVIGRKIELLYYFNEFDEAFHCYDLLINLSEADDYDKIYHDKLLCKEAKAFKLYENNQLDDAIEVYKEIFFYYNNYNFRNSLDSWYKLLSDCLNKYNGDSKNFFKKFYDLNENKIDIWYVKIDCMPFLFVEYALKYCDIILSKEPESYKILLKKAELIKILKPAQSLQLYEKVLEIKEFDEVAVEGKLSLFCRFNWYEKAYEFIKTLPDNFNISTKKLDCIARMLEFYDKDEEAIYCYERLFKLNPQDVNIKIKIKKIYDKVEQKKINNKNE